MVVAVSSVSPVIPYFPSLTIAIPEGASDATRASLSQDNAQHNTIDILRMKTFSLLNGEYNPDQVCNWLKNAEVVVSSEEESSFTLQLTMDRYPAYETAITIRGKFTHANSPIKDSFSVAIGQVTACA